MTVIKKIGRFEVLESGTLVVDGNMHVEFNFDPKNQFIIRFEFSHNSAWLANKPQAEKYGNNGLKFTIADTGSGSGGVGSSEPVRIGTINKKGLYLSYRLFSLTGSVNFFPTSKGHTFHYTWLLDPYGK